jgi:hypothetical protein
MVIHDVLQGKIMEESNITDIEAEFLAKRVAQHSDLLERARKSDMSNREKLIRCAIVVALLAYFQYFDVAAGNVALSLALFFLITYVRDNARREKRIDALVALLGLREGQTLKPNKNAEQNF